MERNYDYRPVRFFLMTYVVTWIPLSIGVYLGSRKGMEAYASLLTFVGLLGPLAVGLFMILTSGSQPLRSDLKDRIFNLRRIRSTYILVAIAMPPVVMGLSIWLSVRFGQSSDQFRLSGNANLLNMIILSMVLAPIIEEMGWRGYGVDSLRAKMGMLKATLLFGVLWSLWHAPLVLIPGTYHNELARMGNPLFLVNFFVSVILVAVIANWLYYKNDRSIIAAILLHSMLNGAAVLPNAGQVAKCIATLLYAAIAAAIIAFDRTTFGDGPHDFVHAANAGELPAAGA